MVATMILALNLAAGFNVVTENPIWLDFDSPDTRGSLFGYSAVLGSDAAYVGAPSFRNSGALFGCSFDGRQFAPRAAGSCSRIDPGQASVFLVFVPIDPRRLFSMKDVSLLRPERSDQRLVRGLGGLRRGREEGLRVRPQGHHPERLCQLPDQHR